MYTFMRKTQKKIKNHDAAPGPPEPGRKAWPPMMMSCSPTGCVILTLVGLWF